MDDDLNRRLGEIERRLGAIEAELALRQPTPAELIVRALPVAPVRSAAAIEPPGIPLAALRVDPEPAPETPPERDAMLDAPVDALLDAPVDAPPHAAVPPPLHPPQLPPLTWQQKQSRPNDPAASPQVVADEGAAVPIAPLTAPPLQYRQRKVGGMPAGATFEQTVGLKWAGWIGAVVLVIGAGLGFKFAYDQGWLGHLPPGPKIGLLALCGLGLIGAGEWVFRRVNRVSAIGLFGSGTAVLFLASYAGFAWYALYGQSIAIALMGASTFVGILVAARTNFVSVAALAILGGNLGPLLIGSDAPQYGPFLVYLLLLQGMALGLCAWQASTKWWSLRGLSLATTAIWMTGLCGSAGRPEALVMAFAILFTLLFQGELCFTTLWAARRQSTVGPPVQTGLVYSLLVTAAFTTWMLLIERDVSSTSQGGLIVVIAAAAYVASFALRALRADVLRGVELSLRVQAALLVTLAIPVALTGPAVLFGWMLLATGFGAIGLVTGRKLPVVGAIATWALAGAFAGMWATDDDASRHVWTTVFGEPLAARLIVAACLALTGHVLGGIVRRRFADAHSDFDPFVQFALDAIAVAILAAGLFFWCSPTFATLSALAYAAALFAASYAPVLSPLGMLGILLLCATAMKWAFLDVLIPLNARTPPPPQRLLLNGQVLVGGLLAIAFGVMGFLQSRRIVKAGDSDSARRASMASALVLSVMAVVAGFTLTLEVHRYAAAADFSQWPGTAARDLLDTILWSVSVAAWLLVTRLNARDEGVRLDVLRVALILSMLLCGKYVIFDVLVPAFAGPGTGVGTGVSVGINLQVLAGVAVIALLSGVIGLARKTSLAGAAERCAMVVPLLLLIIGSAEIDRYARQQTAGPTWIVRQVGWSIYWAALAIALLVIGFARKLKALRVAALGLLGLTLLKVTLIDLSTAGSGWRILSFLGLGAVLLGTSVLYGKFSHRSSY